MDRKVKQLFVILLLMIPFCIEVTGNAKSSERQKALQAYNKYLSADMQNWGSWGKVAMSECEFALKDFNNDKIPELILCYPTASVSWSAERVYGYRNGKVKELFAVYAGRIEKIYPSKGICVVSGMHAGECWEYHYKILKGKCNCVLKKTGSDTIKGHVGKLYYNKYYIGKKKVRKAKYQEYRKKLVGNGKNKKSYRYRKNSKKNRLSILLKNKPVLSKKSAGTSKYTYYKTVLDCFDYDTDYDFYKKEKIGLCYASYFEGNKIYFYGSMTKSKSSSDDKRNYLGDKIRSFVLTGKTKYYLNGGDMHNKKVSKSKFAKLLARAKKGIVSFDIIVVVKEGKVKKLVAEI